LKNNNFLKKDPLLQLQQSCIFDTSKKRPTTRQAGRCSASFRKGEKGFENIFYYILPTIVDLLACRFM
jgi:hypothetical protein